MEDNIYNLLKDLCPVSRQGSVSSYPDLFITYWRNESYDNKHYDNDKTGIIYNYDINVYGKHVLEVENTLKEVITRLKANKYIITGAGNDLVSDDNEFIGIGIKVKYIKLSEV